MFSAILTVLKAIGEIWPQSFKFMAKVREETLKRLDPEVRTQGMVVILKTITRISAFVIALGMTFWMILVFLIYIPLVLSVLEFLFESLPAYLRRFKNFIVKKWPG